MDSPKLDELIDCSHFIDDSHKDQCKQYFKQIHKGLGDWFYSRSISPDMYQGDVVNKLDVVYFQIRDDSQELQIIEDLPCMLLSNTCDMALEGKSREQYISVASIFSFQEFGQQGRLQEYSVNGWENFLKDIKMNRITNILYIPEKTPLKASVIFLDRICSIDPHILKARLGKNKSRRILSLSQVGFYFFLIKLTYHFARYEDRTEIIRE